MISFLRNRSQRGIRLEDGRVYLRALSMADWETWARLREQSQAFLIPWEPLWASDALSKAAFRRRVEHVRYEWERETGYSFLIYQQSDDALLGGITLSNVRRGVAQAGNLGYWVGMPYARLGYMTEAMRAIADFSFGQLRLHRLEAACLEQNTASRGLLTNSGFREIGYARQYLRIAGKWQDHVLFEKLTPER